MNEFSEILYPNVCTIQWLKLRGGEGGVVDCGMGSEGMRGDGNWIRCGFSFYNGMKKMEAKKKKIFVFKIKSDFYENETCFRVICL